LTGVRAVLRDDEQLWELLTTPLFLRIVALAYQGKPAALVRASGTLEERRRRVLADYVEAMLNRPRASSWWLPYPRGQIVSWLAWLAKAMQANAQTVFYLDWIQPDWLPSRGLEQ